MGDEALTLVKDHFDEQIDRIDRGWDERFRSLEKNIDDHFGSCKDSCLSRITTAVEKAEKAHLRLDHQKKAIENLCEHKNKELGFRNAISWIVIILTLVIAYLGLR